MIGEACAGGIHNLCERRPIRLAVLPAGSQYSAARWASSWLKTILACPFPVYRSLMRRCKSNGGLAQLLKASCNTYSFYHIKGAQDKLRQLEVQAGRAPGGDRARLGATAASRPPQFRLCVSFRLPTHRRPLQQIAFLCDTSWTTSTRS